METKVALKANTGGSSAVHDIRSAGGYYRLHRGSSPHLLAPAWACIVSKVNQLNQTGWKKMCEMFSKGHRPLLGANVGFN